uniref:Uncharacterized protein n=1 Tax=Ascaris lumbricoides TaxID=6252 RepID=A0A0M3HN93_ASCLU
MTSRAPITFEFMVGLDGTNRECSGAQPVLGALLAYLIFTAKFFCLLADTHLAAIALPNAAPHKTTSQARATVDRNTSNRMKPAD